NLESDVRRQNQDDHKTSAHARTRGPCASAHRGVSLGCMRPPRGQGGLGRDFKRYRSNCFLTAERSRWRKACYTESETPPGALAASEAPFRGKGRRLGEGAAQGAGGKRRQGVDRGGG